MLINASAEDISGSATVNFSGTPSYSGVNIISGGGAGFYIYRGTGTVGWIKLNQQPATFGGFPPLTYMPPRRIMGYTFGSLVFTPVIKALQVMRQL